MEENSTDCLQCRLVSGGGLAIAGAYVVYQSKNLKPFSRKVVAGIGYGLGALAFLRVFKLPPFRNRPEPVENDLIENKEDNGYIIGKLTAKFN